MAPTKASAFLLAASLALLGAGVVAVLGRLTRRVSSIAPSGAVRTKKAVIAGVGSSPIRALGGGSASPEGRVSEKEEEYGYDPLTIAPGELPGYTGWARPEYTLAGAFRTVSTSGPVRAGEEWFVDVECSAPECRRGGAHFYLRAYGPAVITGAMRDDGDGSYRASFYPVDAGAYAVEVILAFSDAPPFEDFPLAEAEEPGFEGYLLPGFPLRMVAEEAATTVSLVGGTSRSVETSERWCSFEQLVDTDDGDVTIALRSGRWKVVDRVQSGGDRAVVSADPHDVSLSGYQTGINALGATLRYTPTDCKLLHESDMMRSPPNGGHIWDRCLTDAGVANSTDPADQIHFILIGDSVMRLQEEALRRFVSASSSAYAKNVKITRIKMYGGISRSLANVTSALDEIHAANPSERRVMVFNSALHDVDRLCSSEMRGSRKVHFPDISDADLVCVVFYRELLEEFVEEMVRYPAELKVFRTANAAWPKYGNYGFAWPTEKLQPFSRSPNFVAKINEIAYGVISDRGRDEISIVDGYWMTLPRPDNTEVGKINTIGKHMVHPGLEVISDMTAKIFMLALRRICSETIDGWI